MAEQGKAQAIANTNGGIPLSLNQQQVNFLPGTSTYTWQVDLAPDAPQTYVLQAHTGQHLFIHRSGDLTIQVYDATNQPVTAPNSQAGPWEVVIPQDGAYELAVSGSGKGTLSLYIAHPVNSWTPDVSSAPVPDHPQRVGFTEGPTTTASTNLSQGRFDGVTFHALAGQKLQIAIQGDATLTLFSHGDETINPIAASFGQWTFTLPEAGDYTVVILGEGVVQLVITLSPTGG